MTLTQLIDLCENQSGSAGDVHAHVIAAAGVALRERLVNCLGINAIESAKLRSV